LPQLKIGTLITPPIDQLRLPDFKRLFRSPLLWTALPVGAVVTVMTVVTPAQPVPAPVLVLVLVVVLVVWWVWGRFWSGGTP